MFFCKTGTIPSTNVCKLNLERSNNVCIIVERYVILSRCITICIHMYILVRLLTKNKEVTDEKIIFSGKLTASEIWQMSMDDQTVMLINVQGYT